MAHGLHNAQVWVMGIAGGGTALSARFVPSGGPRWGKEDEESLTNKDLLLDGEGGQATWARDSQACASILAEGTRCP